MADFNKEINKKVMEALEGVGVDGVEILQNTAPDATGHLAENIDYHVDGLELTFSMPEYAKYVEYGTPPHWLPQSVIEDGEVGLLAWVEAVGVASQWDVTPKQAAWIVANVIAKKGTRAQPFLRPFFNNKLKKVLKKNLAKAFS